MLASSGVGLKLWNLENLQLVKEYPMIGPRSGQLAYIHNFSAKSDSTQIASVVDTDSINLLSLESQLQIDIKDSIDTKCCSYDMAGRYLATGNSNGFIEIYDIKSQSLKKKTWKVQNSKCVNCICYSKNDRFIAVGNSSGSINLFNTLTNTMSKPWLYHTSATTTPPMVTSIQYSAVNPSLAAGYDDGSTILWDSSKEQPICTFKSHNAPCTSISLSPINIILMVSGGLDGVFTMYDTSTKKAIRQINCVSGITSMEMLKNGWTLASGCADGSIHMYDLRSMDGPYMSAKAHDTSVFCIKFISHVPTSSASSTSSSNKENMKYLASTMNGSSNSSSQSSSEHSMKRSNSYNNQELANIANSPIYNIYSPESNKGSFSSQSTVSLASTNQFSGCGESFVLHKKQTSAYSLNTASQSSTSSNNATVTQTAIITTTANTNDNVTPTGMIQRQNFKPKSRTNEIFSPLMTHERLKQPMIKNLDHLSSTSLPKPLKSPVTNSTQNPIASFSKTLSKPPDLGTPINASDKHSPSAINRAVDFDMEIDQTYTDETHAKATTSAATRENISCRGVGTGASELREIVKDVIDDFRDELMNENFRFKAEMFKEFMQLQADMKKYYELSSPNMALINENARLQEENKRLKKMF